MHEFQSFKAGLFICLCLYLRYQGRVSRKGGV